MSSKAYTDWVDGEWLEVPRKGTRLMCCSCRLTHTLNFRIEMNGGKPKLFMSVVRDERATVNARRALPKTVVVDP
jgi:hypothetical protein